MEDKMDIVTVLSGLGALAMIIAFIMFVKSWRKESKPTVYADEELAEGDRER